MSAVLESLFVFQKFVRSSTEQFKALAIIRCFDNGISDDSLCFIRLHLKKVERLDGAIPLKIRFIIILCSGLLKSLRYDCMQYFNSILLVFYVLPMRHL